MFIITNYKKFESVVPKWPDTNDEYKQVMESIISKSDYIEKEFDIDVRNRNLYVKSSQYLPYVDMYKSGNMDTTDETDITIPMLLSKLTPVAVYDICNKQFKLFYSEGKQLKSGKYLIIKSDNFFDKLEDVYYKIYID